METVLAVIVKQVRWLRVAHISANVADGLIDVAIHRGQVEAAVEVDIEENAAETEALARGLPHAGPDGRIRIAAVREAR